jgi:hypothetical protein
MEPQIVITKNDLHGVVNRTLKRYRCNSAMADVKVGINGWSFSGYYQIGIGVEDWRLAEYAACKSLNEACDEAERFVRYVALYGVDDKDYVGGQK